MRSTLRPALEGAGDEVREAGDGVAGLRLHYEIGADLVIADVVMAERDGIEAIRAQHAEAPQVKTIAMSGGGRAGKMDLLTDARAFGAARTLRQPFEPEELVGTVQELLETHPT